MKKNIISYLAMFLIAALLTLPLIVHFIHLWNIEHSYCGAGISFKQTSLEQARRTLEKQGINTAMPGNGNQVIAFTAPTSLMLKDTAYNTVYINSGDTLESDFVTWSHDFFRERMVQMTINGRKSSLKLSTGQLTRLYVTALKQNGLQDQFQVDTGKRLNYFSAKKAINQLDKTLFEQGIHKAYDYPYDRRRVALILGLSVIFALPLSGLLLTLISLGSESIQYQLWLKQYNKEHTKNWDKLSGTLPQFVSLKESGLKDPIPIHRKLRIRDRFMNMFRPVRSGGVK